MRTLHLDNDVIYDEKYFRPEFYGGADVFSVWFSVVFVLTVVKTNILDKHESVIKLL